MNKERLLYIIILIIVILFWMRSCSNKESRISQQRTVIEEQTSELMLIKVKKDRFAIEKRRAEANLSILKDSYVFLEDSLKAMGIKLKNMQSVVFLAQQTSGNGSGTVRYDTITQTDTLYVSNIATKHLDIDERFFKFRAQLFENDRFNYQYTVYDSLSIVNTTSRKNIFKTWEHNVRVLSANPKTNITGLTSLTVKNKEPFIDIGISVGYGITPAGLQPFLGISATKSIIKL